MAMRANAVVLRGENVLVTLNQQRVTNRSWY